MSERRAVLRYNAPPDSSCQLDHPFTRLYLRAEVHDISRGGIGVFLGMELTPGMVFEIEFAGIRKRATLRHTREIYDEEWLAGFAFEEELTSDELRLTGVIA